MRSWKNNKSLVCRCKSRYRETLCVTQSLKGLHEKVTSNWIFYTLDSYFIFNYVTRYESFCNTVHRVYSDCEVYGQWWVSRWLWIANQQTAKELVMVFLTNYSYNHLSQYQIKYMTGTLVWIHRPSKLDQTHNHLAHEVSNREVKKNQPYMYKQIRL